MDKVIGTKTKRFEIEQMPGMLRFLTHQAMTLTFTIVLAFRIERVLGSSPRVMTTEIRF